MATPERFSPNTARNRRTTLSAAPLSIRHMPMMAARATTTATSAAVLPSPTMVSSTAWTKWFLPAPPGNVPAGVRKPAVMPARINARKAWTRNTVMRTTMSATEMSRIRNGHVPGSEPTA